MKLWWQSVPNKGNTKCKGPKVGTSLASFRKRNKVREAGQRVRRSTVELPLGIGAT